MAKMDSTINGTLTPKELTDAVVAPITQTESLGEMELEKPLEPLLGSGEDFNTSIAVVSGFRLLFTQQEAMVLQKGAPKTVTRSSKRINGSDKPKRECDAQNVNSC